MPRNTHDIEQTVLNNLADFCMIGYAVNPVVVIDRGESQNLLDKAYEILASSNDLITRFADVVGAFTTLLAEGSCLDTKNTIATIEEMFYKKLFRRTPKQIVVERFNPKEKNMGMLSIIVNPFTISDEGNITVTGKDILNPQNYLTLDEKNTLAYITDAVIHLLAYKVGHMVCETGSTANVEQVLSFVRNVLNLVYGDETNKKNPNCKAPSCSNPCEHLRKEEKRISEEILKEYQKIVEISRKMSPFKLSAKEAIEKEYE